MIEIFKIISNIYDDKVTTNILTRRLNNSNMGELRGHDYTLEQKRIYKPVRKNYFSNIELSNYGTNRQSMLSDLNS